MNGKKSLGVNAMLNGLRTVIDLLFPLVTFPYATRTLSVDNVGAFGFSASIIGYFIMLSALGVTAYAIREGSKIRDDRRRLDAFASEVFTINMASTLFSYLLLGVCLYFVPVLRRYSMLISVLSVQIFFATIGTEWVYSIFEEYAYITVRSIVFKLISVAMLFAFVRSEGDTLVYAGISVFAAAGSNLLNFFYARRFCSIRLVRQADWKRHLGPIMVIFSSTVAISIYTCSDSTMLGFMCGEREVGVYAVSSKIYGLAKTMLSAVLIVSVPKLSMQLGKGLASDYRRTLSKVVCAVSLLLFPAVVGLYVLAEECILLLSDASYLEAASSLRLLSIALIFCLAGWIANDCVLIPARGEKVVLIATLASAALNIALNFVFIPFLQVDAVGWSTIAAEALVMVISVTSARKVARLCRWVVSDALSILAGCVLVFFLCRWLKGLEYGPAARVALSALVCGAAYALVLLLGRNTLALEGIEKVRKRFFGA